MTAAPTTALMVSAAVSGSGWPASSQAITASTAIVGIRSAAHRNRTAVRDDPREVRLGGRLHRVAQFVRVTPELRFLRGLAEEQAEAMRVVPRRRDKRSQTVLCQVVRVSRRDPQLVADLGEDRRRSGRFSNLPSTVWTTAATSQSVYTLVDTLVSTPGRSPHEATGLASTVRADLQPIAAGLLHPDDRQRHRGGGLMIRLVQGEFAKLWSTRLWLWVAGRRPGRDRHHNRIPAPYGQHDIPQHTSPSAGGGGQV